MRGAMTLSLLVLTALSAAVPPAEAQTRRRTVVREEVPVLRIRPRSFLDPGTVVEPGSLSRTTSGYAQTQSYLVSPPYAPNRERFSQGVLPDPVTNGPFVGARNPFPPVDFNGPINVHQP
jgi:hypothetical protein